MTVLIETISWYRGDSYPIELTITDADTSTEISLTGYSFLLTVDTLKNPPDNSTKVFEVAGVIASDQVANIGEVSFTPTAIQTAITPKTYFYDIQMYEGTNYIRTIAKDKWKIVQDITK